MTITKTMPPSAARYLALLAALALALAVLMSGCGGGDSSNGGSPSGSTPSTYSVGGAIAGLTAAGLVLANGTDTVSLAAGATTFTFAAALASGASYAVTVKTQPTDELCQVGKGTGQVASTAVTSVTVTCTQVTHSIGGTITGLMASGLVLANGSDTVNLAAGATTFTFATALTSGSSYAVTIKAQPKWGNCHIDHGSGQTESADVTSVTVACTRSWTLVSGSVDAEARTVYGTQGVPAVGNVPGARNNSVSWIDSSGNLWLLGGVGFDYDGTLRVLNDLWRYSPGSGLWTWVSGTNPKDGRGVYGTRGVPAASNLPGTRDVPVSWTDSTGDFWMFGGAAVDSAGASDYINDLWRYDPSSGLWTWVSGASTIDARGVYGTQGVPAAENVPGARAGSVTWIDSAGHLWLFGGQGYDSTGAAGPLNDLWLYSPGNGQWTWVSGSNLILAPGVYGTQGVPAAGNVPSAHEGSVSWIDSAGDLWLFGGLGADSRGYLGIINDLWRYSPGSGLWTWVSGANAIFARGVYGTQGVPAAGNAPGARYISVSWIDGSGDLWLFGGDGFDSAATAGYLSDLWRYSPRSGLWTWVSGSNTANTSEANTPHARYESISWTDSAGNLWLFGGDGGFDYSTGVPGLRNDLWVY